MPKTYQKQLNDIELHTDKASQAEEYQIGDRRVKRNLKPLLAEKERLENIIIKQKRKKIKTRGIVLLD